MAMRAIEHYMDARNAIEGKIIATALAALLAFSAFTPTALAVADEAGTDGFLEVADKPAQVDGSGNEGTPLPDTTGAPAEEDVPVTLMVEADHAVALVDGNSLASQSAVAQADLAFTVQPEEGFQVVAVAYGDEPLEAVAHRRAVSDDAAEEADETPVYVIPAEDLADGVVLKIETEPIEGEDTQAEGKPASEPAADQPAPAPEDTPSTEAVSAEKEGAASETPATVAEALQGAIVESVMSVADESVRTVEAPLLASDDGVATKAASAALYHGGRFLGTRSVSVPADGEAVDVSRVLPVAEPVFKVAGDASSFVLNGKVGVVRGDVQADCTALSQACNDGTQCVTQLRVSDGTVEYCVGGTWNALGEDESLAYFCSKLQNAGEAKDVINVAVEEEVLDTAVEGGHTVQLFVFLGAGKLGNEPALLLQRDLYFGPTVTGLPQGIRLDLGDGVKYQIDAEQCFVTNSDDGGKDEPYTEAEARLLQDNGADRYDGRAISFGNKSHLALVAFVAPRKYTVSYDANGAVGEVPEPFSYETGIDGMTVAVGEPGDLAKEGCHFNGWQMVDSAGNTLGIYQPGEEFAMPASDVVLRALWQEWDEQNYYLANYVWKDTDNNREVLVGSARVTTDEEGNGLSIGQMVSAKAADCPAGYDCSAAAPVELKRVGQVITFYCTKKLYTVTTEYYYDGQLGRKSEATVVPFGTPIVTDPAPADTRSFGDNTTVKTYAFDYCVNKELTVSATESENVVRVYYATDMIGTEDPAASDGVPDKYQAKITFNHEGCPCGTETASQTVVVTLFNESGAWAEAKNGGKATLTKEQIPALTETEGWVVDEEQTNWPEEGVVIAADKNGNADRTFNVKHKLGTFNYEVRFVNEAGEAIADPTPGAALYGQPVPVEGLVKEIEGYALDAIEGADRPIGINEEENVVTLRYAVDELGGAAGTVGDGVPDKYQAAVTYRAEHGVFDTLLPASRTAEVAVSLKQYVDGAWVAVDTDKVDRQIPLTSVADLGYVAGTWDVDPTTADLAAGQSYTFTYSFQKGQFGYRVNYYRGSIADENLIETQTGAATFEDPIPWSNANCPVGFVKEVEVASKPIGAYAEGNVMDVVYPRAYFTVRGTVTGEGSIEGNPNQNLAYGNSSERMIFHAAAGYRIASVTINGDSQEVAPGITSFDFGSVRRVTQNYEVEVRTVPMGAVAIVAPSRSQVYDGTVLKAAPAQISGVPEGFTAEAVVTGEQAGAGTSAAVVDRSTIAIRDSAGKDVTKNFQIEVIDGTLKVDRAPVTVTVADARKVAGAADPTFEGTIEGLVNGEELKNMEFVRTVEGEQAGVYLDALSVRYDYTPNYEVTVTPGTFTILSAAGLTPGTTRGDSGSATPMASAAPRGSVSTVSTIAAARQLLAAAQPASVADLAEPVYADVIGDDSTPMVSRRGGETIEDDATALGAFDEPHCWVHWAMALGMLLTVAYAAAVVARRLGFARRAGRLDDDLTGGELVEDGQPQGTAHRIGA